MKIESLTQFGKVHDTILTRKNDRFEAKVVCYGIKDYCLTVAVPDSTKTTCGNCIKRKKADEQKCTKCGQKIKIVKGEPK